MKITQKQFNKAEKETLNYLLNINNDIFDSINVLRDVNAKYIKSELCLAFIAADTFSRFFSIFNNEENKIDNAKRFRVWLKRFVFNEDNQEYKKYKKEINCDSRTAWRIRNSLIHFYGRPKDKNESLIIGNLDHNFRQEFRIVAKKSGFDKELRFINPLYLIKAIFRGLELQLSDMKNKILYEPNKYINGILRCYQIVKQECTDTINFKK